MPSYREILGRPPDFRVSYRLFNQEEGGRYAPPFQHIRWDFRYEDENVSTACFMIYPEILTPSGEYFPEGQPIPMVGLADVFSPFGNFKSFHAQHIRPGTRGYFMEGGRRVGVYEVLEVTSLQVNSHFRNS